MEKAKRPKATYGRTERIETGCGHLYITMNYVDNKLFEIFTKLGKAGGCPTCQNEALTRTMTVGLRYGIPVIEYINQLKNIKCPSPVWEEGEQILSCADAIARLLEKEMAEHKQEESKEKNTSAEPKSA